jgi:DNA polymerase I-like protein with 3'-5' exonuclease and polymerase domains
MRDRILKGGPFSELEKAAILEYCVSDTKYLPAIFRIMKHEIKHLSKNKDDELYFKRAFVKGAWAVRLAMIEAAGIPVNVSWLKNIGRNASKIRNELIKTLVEEVYPFYWYNKKKDVWVEKEDLFGEFIKKNGLEKSWPKTPTGGYAKSKEILEDNEDIPEIKEYRRVRDSLGQIRAFTDADGFVDVVPFDSGEDDSPSTEGKENIFQRIGSDGRLRCYFNPYGTQTSRNAPPAKNFILAMSAWLRSCINPPEGYAITGVDYSSEEFIIAACEAKDKNMEAAYDSGDVYIGFAKQAGSVPKDATKKSHPVIRDEFKAVVLGMQFSLGIKRLHRKVTRDTGIDKGEEHARDLARLHRDTFSDYWAYSDANVESYVGGNPLRTRDGWFLFCDNPNPRSAGNFPIQGAGGAVLRRAVMYAQQAGLVVVSPLHDALYVQHRVDDTEAVKTLMRCMNQAFKDFYGRDIRMEAKTWANDQIFIEGKGRRYYNRLKEYFLNPGDLLWMEELQ